MSAPRIIVASLLSFCQKLSKMMEIWRSSGKKKQFCTVIWDTVYRPGSTYVITTNKPKALCLKFALCGVTKLSLFYYTKTRPKRSVDVE